MIQSKTYRCNIYKDSQDKTYVYLIVVHMTTRISTLILQIANNDDDDDDVDMNIYFVLVDRALKFIAWLLTL